MINFVNNFRYQKPQKKLQQFLKNDDMSAKACKKALKQIKKLKKQNKKEFYMPEYKGTVKINILELVLKQIVKTHQKKLRLIKRIINKFKKLQIEILREKKQTNIPIATPVNENYYTTAATDVELVEAIPVAKIKNNNKTKTEKLIDEIIKLFIKLINMICPFLDKKI